jgi:hypothetical protein
MILTMNGIPASLPRPQDFSPLPLAPTAQPGGVRAASGGPGGTMVSLAGTPQPTDAAGQEWWRQQAEAFARMTPAERDARMREVGQLFRSTGQGSGQSDRSRRFSGFSPGGRRGVMFGGPGMPGMPAAPGQ